MEIKKLNLNNYGKFQDKEINFSNHLNIVYGRNEQGKSTVHSFIEGILTGLNSARYDLEADHSRFERYKPWGQKEQFNGELEYQEGTKDYLVYRDFAKAGHGIKFYEDGEMKEVEVIDNESDEKPQFLNVLGITDITNKTGNPLIEELKNYISNVGSTNSTEVSVEEAIDSIDSKITEIEDTSNYNQAKEQIEQYNKKLNEIENSQIEQKEALKIFFDMEKKRKEAQDKLSRLENELDEYLKEYDSFKEQKYAEYEKQILLLQQEMELLTKEQEDSYQELDKTMELRAKYQSNVNRISECEIEITKLLEEKRIALKEVNPDMARVLSIPAEREDLLNDFRDYLHVKEELDAIDEEIHKYQKLIADESTMKAMTNDGGNVIFEHLERDYQNLINQNNWMKTLMEEEKNVESTEGMQNRIDKLKRKKGSYKLALTIFQILLLLFILGGLIISNMMIPFIALFVVVGGLTIVSIVKYKETSRELSKKINKIHDLEEAAITNKERIQKNKDKINRLLEKYKQSSVEEFSRYFEAQKTEKESEKNYLRRLDESLTKKDDLRSDEQIRRTHMHDWFHRIGVHQDESYTLDLGTLKRLETVVNRSQKLYEIDFKIREFETQVEEIKDKNYVLGKDIHQSELVASTKTQKSLEQRGSRDEWAKLNHQLEELMAKRSESEDPDDEKEALQLKIRELKEEVEFLQQEKEEARLRANRISSDRVTHSRVKKKLNQLTVKVERIEEQLFLLNEAKKSIQEMVLELLDVFKDSLSSKINTLVYQVTGKYKEVVIDEDMDIFVIDDTNQEKIGIEDLSLGTIDQIHFALRVGLISSVSDDITIPLILDDCFVQYDDERLVNILKEVSKLERQVIIFTCHTREKEIFDNLNVEFNYVEL